VNNEQGTRNDEVDLKKELGMMKLIEEGTRNDEAD
jgi:hypothetical protein